MRRDSHTGRDLSLGSLCEANRVYVILSGSSRIQTRLYACNPAKAIELYKKVGFKVAYKGLTYLRKID